jgi:hypothetical protein
VDLRSSLIRILTQARKRSILHLLLDYLVLTATIAMGGALVILLAGSDALSWLWLVLLTVGSLGAGLYLARKRFPSIYVVAQRIDERLKLADTLSTAAFFLESPGATEAAIREGQRRQAEQLAESVDLKQALPLSRPRAFYAAIALAAAVAGILLMRYAILGSFDPKAPLAQNAFPSVFSPAAKQPQADKPDDDGSTPNDTPEQNKENGKNNDYAGEPPPDMNTPTLATPKDPGSQKSDQPDQPTDSKDNMQPQLANDQSQDKQNQQDSKQEGKQDAKSNQDQSMMDKLRQALNDMLNKMKSQPNDNAKNQKSDQQSQSEQQNGSESQAEAKSSGEQGKQGSEAKDGSSGQGKSSPQQQSGIGKSEGDKEAKQAEALRAMGKISELIGKRAENVKGMVMVEVGSTKQQLKTQITESQAIHGEAGSEIHRDEVPPVYEDFVQQYFEQIRKAPAAGQAAEKTSPPPAPSKN